MYCRNCGKQVDDQAVVCVGCGVPPRKARNFCPQCGKPTDPMAVACPSCGVALGTGGTASEERTFGLLAHLLALAGYVFPFGNIIGPLVIWLMKKDQYPFVDDQGKESLNFQISMMIYMAVSAVLILIGIGIVLVPAVALVDLIFVIIAATQANQGIAYRYPLCIRFIN